MTELTPSLSEFKRLSKKFNVVPVTREIPADTETPVSCFLKNGDKAYSYLLESVEGGEKLARFSFIGGKPALVFKSKGKRITLESASGKTKTFDTQLDPLAELEKILSQYHQAPMADLPPFSGGAVGYLSYDTVRFYEKIPDKNKDVQQIPDSLFIFTDTLFVFDHIRQTIKVVSNAMIQKGDKPEVVYRRATQKIDEQIRALRGSALPKPIPTRSAKIKMSSNFSKKSFGSIVKKAQAYIRKGDIFQVVLSQAFSTDIHNDAFHIYRSLRSVNPSPYMFYINGGDFQLVGSSPEVHVRCENGKAMLRPIAGTRPRGTSTTQDKKFESDLLADTKERAEHLMLVDLGRNDLGRVCAYKSVKVPEFMTIERYSHVMHIVSLVEGQLRKGQTAFDLLRATFPAGTVSGAPKVRAMEIIDELENQKRGFYSGVVGYFGYSGNLDSCITIRTILVKNKRAYVQAGAGIVTDSKPAMEYQETVNKAKALVRAIELSHKEVFI